VEETATKHRLLLLAAEESFYLNKTGDSVANNLSNTVLNNLQHLLLILLVN